MGTKKTVTSVRNFPKQDGGGMLHREEIRETEGKEGLLALLRGCFHLNRANTCLRKSGQHKDELKRGEGKGPQEENLGTNRCRSAFFWKPQGSILSFGLNLAPPYQKKPRVCQEVGMGDSRQTGPPVPRLDQTVSSPKGRSRKGVKKKSRGKGPRNWLHL